jgi:hypothetical protein
MTLLERILPLKMSIKPKKKPLTILEFAAMGGRARAQKLSKEKLSEIGKKGGRPRKNKVGVMMNPTRNE